MDRCTYLSEAKEFGFFLSPQTKSNQSAHTGNFCLREIPRIENDDVRLLCVLGRPLTSIPSEVTFQCRLTTSKRFCQSFWIGASQSIISHLFLPKYFVFFSFRIQPVFFFPLHPVFCFFSTFLESTVCFLVCFFHCHDNVSRRDWIGRRTEPVECLSWCRIYVSSYLRVSKISYQQDPLQFNCTGLIFFLLLLLYLRQL